MRTTFLNLTVLALGAAVTWGQSTSPAVPARPSTNAHSNSAPRPARAGAASYLGVEVRDVTPDRTGALGLKDTRGAEIIMVDHDAPAARAGLREHDVITSLNGTKANRAEQMRDIIRKLPAGSEVTIGIVRDGQPMSIKTKLGKRGDVYVARNLNGPVQVEMAEIMVPPMSAMVIDVPGFSGLQYSLHNGAIVEDLTPQLAEYFGVRNGGGILVRQVLHGTSAEAAGLRAGDVMIRAGRQRVRSYADWRRVRPARAGTLPITVIRERRQQTLAMKFPEAGGPEPMPLDMSDMNAEMQELQQRMQELGPEIEQAARQAQIEFERHMRELQRAQKAHMENLEKARAQRAHAVKMEGTAPAQTPPSAPASPAGNAAPQK